MVVIAFTALILEINKWARNDKHRMRKKRWEERLEVNTVKKTLHKKVNLFEKRFLNEFSK